jgi:hypothetical protein
VYTDFHASWFRNFADVTLPDLAPINLITGVNDAGKSSLLEAIYLLTCEGTAGNHMLGHLAQNRGVVMGMNQRGPLEPSPWANYFHNFDISRPMSFRADDDAGLSASLKISLSPDRLFVPVTVGASTPEPLLMEVGKSGIQEFYGHVRTRGVTTTTTSIFGCCSN